MPEAPKGGEDLGGPWSHVKSAVRQGGIVVVPYVAREDIAKNQTRVQRWWRLRPRACLLNCRRGLRLAMATEVTTAQRSGVNGSARDVATLAVKCGDGTPNTCLVS